MTGSEIITGVKTLLHADANEKMLDDSEIIVAMNIAIRNYASQLAASSSKRYYKVDSDTLTSGSESMALPDDCNGKVDFVKYNKQILKPTNFHAMLDEPGNNTPSRVAVVDDDIYFYPAPSSDITVTVGYWRVPTMVTDSNKGNDIDFPDIIAPLIMFDAAIFCALKHESYAKDIRDLRNEWYVNLNYMKTEPIKLTSYAVREAGDVKMAVR